MLSEGEKTVSDMQFLQELKKLLRICQLIRDDAKKAPAIVFDIDGTLVHDGTWDKPVWSVINFCNYCKEIGITTIIVTARPGWEANITNTKNSLQELGIVCDAFFFRKPECTNLDDFKLSCRKHIDNVAQYNILLSIGDNPWDIGEYGGSGVLMKAHPSSNAITYTVKS